MHAFCASNVPPVSHTLSASGTGPITRSGDTPGPLTLLAEPWALITSAEL